MKLIHPLKFKFPKRGYVLDTDCEIVSFNAQYMFYGKKTANGWNVYTKVYSTSRTQTDYTKLVTPNGHP